MWPFKKRPSPDVAPASISYSQLDITEAFDDNLRLGADDWIATIPVNTSVPDPQAQGLPAVGAGADEVYRIAQSLSILRESFDLPDDGVYCPICHIANTSLARLHTPCPRCKRPLLKFGWT